MKNPSQSAIAKKAGVARTTVSLVLRGGEGLAQDTIDKVMKAAKELGYRPNLLVQGIRTGRSKTVGVMIPPNDSYWSEIIYGIHDELAQNDYAPIFLWSAHREEEFDSDRELKQVHRLIDRRIDGVILWPAFAKMYECHLKEFSSRSLPVVSIDYQIENPELQSDSIYSNDAIGAKKVSDHLLESKPKSFVHFCGPDYEVWSALRIQGAKEALAEHPGVTSVFQELSLFPPRTDSINAVRETLKDIELPAAVFAATDKMARDVYTVARELDLKIPEDIKVAGYGNLDFAEELTPSLTSVKADPYQIGRTAAATLLSKIDGTPVEVDSNQFSLELIVRESSQ